MSGAREAGWGSHGQEVRGGVCPAGGERVSLAGVKRWCSGREECLVDVRT